MSDSGKRILHDELRRLADRLDDATHGQKGTLIAEFCSMHGWGRDRLYRALKKIGWNSGRKRRADAGRTEQDEHTLDELAAMVRCGMRKNDKATMEVPNARSILQANGRDIRVSNATLARNLRQRHQDIRSQRQASPHTRMRSLHPNHVHEVDPSLCLLFYTPDGQQHLIRDDEAYKNKPEYLERVGELKCWRYVLVDHYSNVVIVRYYQAKGETQANLWDFLLYCWSRREGRPFHGVCKQLVWDKGSANAARAIKNALKALDVQHYEHKAGNPRTKGSVEEANNRVEKLFESRLKYEPVASLDELNQAAEAWYNAYNADRVPGYDARLRRRGMVRPTERYGIWQRYRPEQLRILPDPDVCRYLLTSDPEERTVNGNLVISFRHPIAKRSLQYDLRGIDGVYRGGKVLVSPLVTGEACSVIVQVNDSRGESREHLVDPVQYDEAGFPLGAPVWGERFERLPDTVVDQAQKGADRTAYPNRPDEAVERAKNANAPPLGGLNAHSHLAGVFMPEFMERPGTTLDVPQRVDVELKPLSHIEALKRLRDLLGRAINESENRRVRARYPDGVPETELEEVAAWLSGRGTEPGAPKSATR